MINGWIKLHRKLQDNPMWLSETFTRGQAWVDLLMLANHKKHLVWIRGISVTILSGQVLAGEQYLANRWKWSRGRVRRFMSWLEQKTVQQIVQQKNNVCTVITITNWKDYQTNGTADSTANGTTDGQQTDTPKNDKKAKKKNSATPRAKFKPPTHKEAEAYFVEKNYKGNVTDEAERFINHYEASGWCRGRGQGIKLKDWKAAVRNWIKNDFSYSKDSDTYEANRRTTHKIIPTEDEIRHVEERKRKRLATLEREKTQNEYC